MANEFKVSDLATHVATLHRFLGDCMIDADKNTDAKISRDCKPVRDSAQALLDLVGPGPAADSDPVEDPSGEQKPKHLDQETAMDSAYDRKRRGHKPPPSIDSIFTSDPPAGRDGGGLALDDIFKR